MGLLDEVSIIQSGNYCTFDSLNYFAVSFKELSAKLDRDIMEKENREKLWSLNFRIDKMEADLIISCPMEKLLLIDGLNIVRRVYEANPAPDSSEKADGAIQSSFASFKRLLKEHEPTHVLAAFDHDGLTWRHALYPQYREDRKPMPIELRYRLPGFFERLQELRVPVVSIPDVEADDVIGTAALRWLTEGRGEVIVASTDKDLHVLIAAGARIWHHFDREWHDAEWVEKKYGVEPYQLPDFFALMGDSSDGIPGVDKVGQKTAARLLKSYKDLDGVMAGAGILFDPLGKRLRQYREMAYLSQKLATLKTDVKIGVTWKMLAHR